MTGFMVPGPVIKEKIVGSNSNDRVFERMPVIWTVYKQQSTASIVQAYLHKVCDAHRLKILLTVVLVILN